MTAGRITNIFAALALGAFVAVAGASCKKAAARSTGQGTTSGTIFSNSFFGLSLPIPAGWSVAGMAVTNSPSPKADSSQLLLISEKPISSRADSNPTLLVVAEKISLSGARTPRAYLEYIARMFTDSVVRQGTMLIPYSTNGKIQELKLGARAGARINLTARIGERQVLQSYFSTILDGYAVSVVISAMSEEDLRRLETIVESSRFVPR